MNLKHQLIVQYMGYQIGVVHGIESGSKLCAFKKINGDVINPRPVDRLNYDKSWAELMPVLSKIAQTNAVEHTQKPGECRCIIAPLEIGDGFYVCKIGIDPLKVAFEAAVAYIEWTIPTSKITKST